MSFSSCSFSGFYNFFRVFGRQSIIARQFSFLLDLLRLGRSTFSCVFPEVSFQEVSIPLLIRMYRSLIIVDHIKLKQLSYENVSDIIIAVTPDSKHPVARRVTLKKQTRLLCAAVNVDNIVTTIYNIIEYPYANKCDEQ